MSPAADPIAELPALTAPVAPEDLLLIEAGGATFCLPIASLLGFLRGAASQKMEAN